MLSKRPEVLRRDFFHIVTYKVISKQEYLDFNKMDFDYTLTKKGTCDFTYEWPFRRGHAQHPQCEKIIGKTKKISHAFL